MLKVLTRSASRHTWLGFTTVHLFSLSGIFLISFLLAKAQFMGELYPFGVSILAAVCVTYRNLSKPALLGVIIGTILATKGWVMASYMLSIILLYLILYYYRKAASPWFLVPVLVLAIHLLVRGTGVLILDNQLYQWVGVSFESFFSGVLTLVSVTGLQAFPKVIKDDLLTAEERTSIALIVLGSIIGVGQTNLGGIGLQSVISRWLVLWGSYLGGPGGGAVVGVVVGLIPCIQGTLTTGPVAFYALAGLLAGIFNSFNKPGVIVGFILANLLLSLFFAEQVVIQQTFKETAVAVVGFLLFQLPQQKNEPGLNNHNQEASNLNNQPYSTEKLNKIAQIFYEIEKVLQNNQHYKIENPELSVLFNRVANMVCEGCSLHRVCWEQDFYKTYRAMLEACTRLETAGSITEKDFGIDIKRRCMRLRELSTTLNSQLEYFKVINAYEKQIKGCHSLVTGQLVGMARVVEGFAEELKKEVYPMDSYIPLKEELEEKGICIKNIKIKDRPDGEKEIIISQAVCPEKNWCKSMVAPNVSQLLGKIYKVKSKNCTDKEGDDCSYHLIPSSVMQIKTGKAQQPKDGVKVSGDVCSSFILPDQRFALVLSDGMGAGEEACALSTAAISLLEKLLAAGFSAETAVKTVNSVLFLRSGKEDFVTLDVVIINQINGLTDFIKIGGAPSFIYSHKGIKYVQAFVPPVGILEKIDIQIYRHVVIPNNIIVMMSDGVWEALYNAGGPEGWLDDVMKKMDLSNPEQIALNLLYLAKKAAKGAKDDLSVQVARVEQQEIA